MLDDDSTFCVLAGADDVIAVRAGILLRTEPGVPGVFDQAATRLRTDATAVPAGTSSAAAAVDSAVERRGNFPEPPATVGVVSLFSSRRTIRGVHTAATVELSAVESVNFRRPLTARAGLEAAAVFVVDAAAAVPPRFRLWPLPSELEAGLAVRTGHDADASPTFNDVTFGDRLSVRLLVLLMFENRLLVGVLSPPFDAFVSELLLP